MPDTDLARITPVTDATVARLASSAAYDELASRIMTAPVPDAPAAVPAQAPAPGRGRRVSRWLAPVAAMVAVATIAGVTVAGREAGRGPASASQPAAGRPKIYVTVAARYLHPSSQAGDARLTPYELTVGTATIRDASTGAALMSMQLWPRQPEHPRGPAVGGPTNGGAVSIAAAADNRTFAIGDVGGRIYLLHVAASGRAARLERLSITFRGGGIPTFDLSPDGAKLAAAIAVPCPTGGNCAGVDGIEIITLATGAARTWLYSLPADGATNASWTDNGTAVMFQWSGDNGASGYRILSDDAPQGNLLAESAALPYPPVQRSYPGPTAVLTPDGRNLLIATQSIVPASRNSGTIILRITDVAPRTGKLLRVLRVFQTHYQGNPYATAAVHGLTCNILSFAPGGLHVLVQCPQLGRLDGTTFTPLPSSGLPGLPDAPTLGVAW